MENNSIQENPNKRNINQGESFITLDTPGFLVPENKTSIKPEDVNNIVAESSTTHITSQEQPLLRAINETTHTIDSSSDVTSNPSSIFNISLLPNEPININHAEKKDNDEKQIENNTNLEPIDSSSDIDFFTFDFSSTAETKPVETVEEPLKINNDNPETFNFSSAIRPSENVEVLPDDSNHIEFSKFLESRENIIKNADEVSENDNNVIRVNDDTASDSYHNKNNAIKISVYGFYAMLAILLIFFGYKIYKNATDFDLTRDEITLAINSTYQAEIVANSKLQDNRKYEWSSSNTEIVQVDENGLITSISSGEATITVKKGRNEKKLTVTAIDIVIESITFKEKSIDLKVGESETLQPIINNDETIVIDLIWETDDPTIVSVDENGRITANGVGTTSVYVYDEVSGLGGEISINVTSDEKEDDKEDDKNDNENPNESIPVTKIALNKSDTIMEVGEYIIVSAVVRPSNATNKKVTWTSSNTRVATVSSSGKITAKNVGTATITAKTSNGKTAKIKITVTEKFINVTSIALNKTSASLNVGSSITLTATVSPKNATNKGIIWSSSDSSVATVTTSGKVIAKGAGTATITATTKDGGKKATCTITVKEKEIINVSKIELSESELNLEVGDSRTITATVTPSNATYPDITWETSNKNVATVSNGKITAVGPGTAIITASSNNGKSATVQVTVKAKVINVESITISPSQITIKVGDSRKISYTIKPDNATNKGVTFSDYNSDIISVDKDGNVKGLKAGRTNITITTKDGDFSKRLSVVVEEIEPEPEPEPTPSE